MDLRRELDIRLSQFRLDEVKFMSISDSLDRAKLFKAYLIQLHTSMIAWANKKGILSEKCIDDPDFEYINPKKKKYLTGYSSALANPGTGLGRNLSESWLILSMAELLPGEPKFVSSMISPMVIYGGCTYSWRNRNKLEVFATLTEQYSNEIEGIRSYYYDLINNQQSS